MSIGTGFLGFSDISSPGVQTSIQMVLRIATSLESNFIPPDFREMWLRFELKTENSVVSGPHYSDNGRN